MSGVYFKNLSCAFFLLKVSPSPSNWPAVSLYIHPVTSLPSFSLYFLGFTAIWFLPLPRIISLSPTGSSSDEMNFTFLVCCGFPSTALVKIPPFLLFTSGLISISTSSPLFETISPSQSLVSLKIFYALFFSLLS